MLNLDPALGVTQIPIIRIQRTYKAHNSQNHACTYVRRYIACLLKNPYTIHALIVRRRCVFPALNPYYLHDLIFRRQCVCPALNPYTMHALIVRRQCVCPDLDPLQHACSHSQETMCVSRPRPPTTCMLS